MLYGRDVECRLVDDLLQAARRGRSGALVLRGEAGIGKTALIGYAASSAADGRLLEARGVQAETTIPFAGLHALLHRVVDRMPALSPAQRRALNVALGLEIGEPPSRFLVSAALVELLAVLAEDRLLVCLVDDAQWVDPQSLAAITFAGRRLSGDRIAMLFGLRSEDPAATSQPDRLLADLPHVRLTRLDDPAAERLLDHRRLDPPDREAVREAAGGNPLALTVLGPGRGSGLPSAPLTLTEQVEADYVRRTTGLDRRVRDLLLLAAADDTGDLAVLVAAAGQLGAAEGDLATAEQRGLLRVTRGRVDFSHPLVRSAVYQSAGFAACKRAHLALADAFKPVDPARATWHRAAVALPPAEDVAGELAEIGAAAVRRAAADVASRAYEAAGRLTGQPGCKIGWLLDAAETAWQGGQVERAATLVAQVRETAPAEADPGRLDQLRGQVEAVTGSAVQGYEILLAGAQSILRIDPDRAASMLYAALRAASVAGDMERVTRTGPVAARLLEVGTRPAPACFAAGIAELLTGSGEGAVATLEEGISAVRDSTDPELLYMAAAAAAFAGDRSESQLLASRAVTLCRETGALATLAQALEPLVVAQLDVAPRQAEASADEGLRAARETDQPASAAVHLAWLATVAALRGERPATEELAGQVFELDREHGLAYPAALAVRALGLLELSLGQPAEALVHLESIVLTQTHRAAQLVTMDLAMLAAVWSGRRDRARALLDSVGSWPWLQEAAADWAAPTLDRWRALVSEDSVAVALYERSLAGQSMSPRPFLTALTHLLLGEQLRRMRRRSAARPHLRAAMEAFERLDAIPWAARARSELRASGETVHRRDSAERLTPQELQVAQLVATGASTKAVAAQLFLSPRTVDAHLRQIFTKLGISSRTELRDLDLIG